jgi:hypothetical protein
MLKTTNSPLKRAMTGGRVIAITMALIAIPATLLAQPRDEALQNYYPEIAQLFNAFDVVQANMFEELGQIGTSPASETARIQFENRLVLMATSSMQEIMEMAAQGQLMDMTVGPFDEMESAARSELGQSIREQYSNAEAVSAISSVAALSDRAAAVISHGRSLEAAVYNIYADPSVADKQGAVDAALNEYQSNQQLAAPSEPKMSALMFGHDHATAFLEGYPKLSGLAWTAQWFQLAALEGLILQGIDDQFADAIDVSTKRFWDKVGVASGLSFFPAPIELPMAPTIAPQLYSQHPLVAITIDNLNRFETVIFDILSYPNLQNRESLMDTAAAEFTNGEDNIDRNDIYLLSALRGGIFYQGGPAVGDLPQPERNRSRSYMEMQHSSVMPNDLQPQF